MDCLQAGVNVLLEKPITRTVEEADALISEAAERDLVLQAGHLERFNAAVMAVKGLIKEPMFLESHRLAPFKPRGTDVNVVLDLMIHDIDIILSMVPGEISCVEAVGVPVITKEVDIANTRINFKSGCVANATASRVSRETVRKIRVFQPDSYISIDYQDRSISILRRDGKGIKIPELPDISLEEQSFEQGDPLLEQIRAFIHAVRTGEEPLVTGEDGKKALELANLITGKFITYQAL
jgi:predicted dehydrogenase